MFLTYMYMHAYTIHAYTLYAGGGDGVRRGVGREGGEGMGIQVKRSKGYIHILYMYFILRVVYYTHVYIYILI